MAKRAPRFLTRLRENLRVVFYGPQALAFLSAVMLAAYWWGGETVLVGIGIIVPVLLLALHSSGPNGIPPMRDSGTGVLQRAHFEDMVAHIWQAARDGQTASALLFLELDDFDGLMNQHGQAAADTVAARVMQRIVTALRDDDVVTRTGDARFAICCAPSARIDLEICIQLAGRIQCAIEEPIAVDGTTVYMSCAVGFCLNSRAPESNAESWMTAARTALLEARRRGPSTIRAYSQEMQLAKTARTALREEAAVALESGHIQPWYQPQISTDTGRVTGFEALARWVHPDRGVISPAEFLPALDEAGLLERLSEVMMYHTFTALKAWDAAGVQVPQVGVNFSGSELRNPRLVEKITWELDRFDLAPERLAVEVLETVVTATPDDVVCRNLSGLGKLGCRIDLDDFGTGNASIAAIRRFSVTRIKIDRSFVMKSDRDPEQQRMISAILTMAERLQVETLAEGVETVGEHALLAQLGCDHVQGFGICKPIPFEQTLTWIRSHDAKLADAPSITGRRGNCP
ncbi:MULTISPECIES: putative bifunctional diguanylate cyclase/phosphodiesterase [Roseobacteraceae]|jgi:diguanylate cyclase (GGDEF)-like protein|uniref:Putative signaling protein n=1 Tax=Pseudosulfitobacter pseudonitzschiae TaxID=1402135 RepID=A0A221K2X7_9RHOB|nr:MULTISPECIES: phosphodiesterase [Roseobacteraceae]ASM73358.1 putative signaling protein [Pseudosulfitobacter pseudonitzschiae]